MHAVVGDITGDDQADRRHVQHRGLVGVGVSGLDGHDRIPLKQEAFGGYRLSQDGSVREQVREDPVPQLRAALCGLAVHHLDGAFGGVDRHPREAIYQFGRAGGDHTSGEPSGMRSPPARVGPSETNTSYDSADGESADIACLLSEFSAAGRWPLAAGPSGRPDRRMT